MNKLYLHTYTHTRTHTHTHTYSHLRCSVIVNIFGIPLNLIVVAVFLSIKQLGVSGQCSRAILACALRSGGAGAVDWMTP